MSSLKQSKLTSKLRNHQNLDLKKWIHFNGYLTYIPIGVLMAAHAQAGQYPIREEWLSPINVP